MPALFGPSHLAAGTSLRQQGSDVLQRTIDRDLEERLRREAEYEANRRQERGIRAQKAMQKHAETVANERMWTQMGIGVGAGALGGGIAGLAAAPAAGATAAGGAAAGSGIGAAGGSVAAPMSLNGAKMAVPEVAGGIASLPSAPIPSAGSRFATGFGLGGLDALAGTNHTGAYLGGIANAPMNAMKYNNAIADLANTGMRTGLVASQIATEDARRPGRVDMDVSRAEANRAQAGASNASAGYSDARTNAVNILTPQRLATEAERTRSTGAQADLRGQAMSFNEQMNPARLENMQERTNTSKASGAKFGAQQRLAEAQTAKAQQTSTKDAAANAFIVDAEKRIDDIAARGGTTQEVEDMLSFMEENGKLKPEEAQMIRNKFYGR